MRRIMFVFILMCVSIGVYGQTAGDALRYSYWTYAGSARYMGVAGSMGALGGDYSSIINNPAGIAAYRRSELTFTPVIHIAGVDSEFNGSEYSDKRTTVNVSQAGLVFASAKSGDWKSVNFGIGYNRLADFNNQFNYRGETEGSIADYFLELANGLTLEQLSDYDSGLAYDTGLIYQPNASDPTNYENDFLPGDRTNKSQTISERGSLGELNLSIGGNMNHKLYVGLSVGIPFVDYRLSKTFTESEADVDIPYYQGVNFAEGLTTSGVGVNVNLGFIYRVNQVVRLGGAIHTPTWISLTDSFNSSLDFEYFNNGAGGTNTSESPIGTFEYKMKTPWRFMGNAGFIIKKSGFISLEAEWVDYSKNKYNYDSDFSTTAILAIEEETNNQIKTIFQSGLNLKIGGEYVIRKLYRVRAGYALMGNPYVNNAGMFSDSRLSVGLGYRKDNFFIDMAYSRLMREQTYVPYVLTSGFQNGPVINNNLSADNIILTVGFKFGGKRAK